MFIVSVCVYLGKKYRTKCWFDRKDWLRFQGLSLHIGKRGYVVISRYDPLTKKSRQVYAHREILKVTNPDISVDHRNNRPTDNRRHNLRLSTQSQNMANKSVSSRSKSKYKGVVLRRDRYCVFVKCKGKTRYFGSYVNAETAARVFDREAVKNWGEFACLNFPELDSSSFFPTRSSRVNGNDTKTHCPQGHLLDSVNNQGYRFCSTCNRRRCAEYRKKKNELC